MKNWVKSEPAWNIHKIFLFQIKCKNTVLNLLIIKCEEMGIQLFEIIYNGRKKLNIAHVINLCQDIII